MNITATRFRSIEYVLPKLKYSCYINDILKWLKNFDESEFEDALDFLFYLEYITFSELQYRLVEQLKKAIKKIPNENNIVLVPFGKYAKSSDIMIYLIKKTDYYKRKERAGKLSVIRDKNSIDLINKVSVVFLDDFIGSGNSFIKDYRKTYENFIKKSTNINSNIFLIAAIVMTDGKNNINIEIPEVEILAQERRNIFDIVNSPFQIGKGPDFMKKLAIKYGSKIKVDFDKTLRTPIYRPLGYDDIGSLVAFDYGCPNNTLSIIWGNDQWNPIFPRFAKDRMRQAKEFKKAVAFYIGIMNKMGIDLYNDASIMVHGKREIKYNTREDHSLLTYLKLKVKKFDDLLICQILGVTLDELREIEIYGEKKFVFKNGTITSHGFYFIDKLTKLANGVKNKLRRQNSFERKELNYLPDSFN